MAGTDSSSLGTGIVHAPQGQAKESKGKVAEKRNLTPFIFSDDERPRDRAPAASTLTLAQLASRHRCRKFPGDWIAHRRCHRLPAGQECGCLAAGARP